jgi:diacylglycerol O-acyltransferase
MRGSDAFTWHMERDPSLRSTIVSVVWLDEEPDWKVFAERVDHVTRVVTSLRRRVVPSPLPLVPPRWTADPHFDLHWHLRRAAAPPPYTRDAVLEIARRAAMDAFDRDRPLWEATLVGGIRDERARAALVMKIHHSLTDGVGAMRLMPVLFDLQRDPPDADALASPVEEGEDVAEEAGIAAEVGAAVGYWARLAQHAVPSLASAFARGLLRPVGSVKEATEMARSVYRTAAPIGDTKSPVMVDRAMTRRLVMLELPLAGLRKAARSVDCTVNDAYLAGITGGLRRYHELRHAPVESLRVTMPISIRDEDDVSWGNRITLQRLTVPVGESDPAERMRALHRVGQRARAERSLPVTDTIASALNMLPVAYVGGILKHVDFLASNIPGAPIPVYLAGAEVTGMFAFGPTIGCAMNLTLISYLDTCDIGLNIDTAAVPDPDVLVDCLRQGFEEVVALSGPGPDHTG